MVLRVATHSDFNEIVRITSAAREFLASQGSDQWQGGWPTLEVLESDIANGVGMLAVDEETGAVLGYYAAVCKPEADYDRVYSGAWLTITSNDPVGGTPEYLVIHRMATAPEARGKGVATFMVHESLRLAREQGMRSVRVDTHHKNVPMQHTFEKVGFTRCCEITITSEAEPTKERVGYEYVLE